MGFITVNPVLDLATDSQPSIYYLDDGVAVVYCLDSPEGAVIANAGTFATSRTGRSFVKTTDGGNTGWAEIPAALISAQQGFEKSLFRNIASASTSGTGLDPLHTVTIPAGAFDIDGEMGRLVSHGSFTGTLGTKRLLVRFNSSQTLLDTGNITANNAFWRFEMTFFRISGTIFDAISLLQHTPFASTGSPTQFSFGYFAVGPNPPDANSITFHGEVANAGDSVGQDATILTIV